MTLQRVSTVEAACNALREQVLDGSLPPGQALREAALCAELGVSRHSMRVALSTLHHEGLLRHEPNRGVFVRTLTPEEISDCYRVRTLLEMEAIRTICGNLAALAPARRAGEKLSEVSEGAEWTVIRDADLAFHSSLVDALGSRHMTRAYSSLIVELKLCFLLEGLRDMDHRAVADEHLAMLEIFESGNFAASVRVLSDHLSKSEHDAVRAVELAADEVKQSR